MLDVVVRVADLLDGALELLVRERRSSLLVVVPRCEGGFCGLVERSHAGL